MHRLSFVAMLAISACTGFSADPPTSADLELTDYFNAQTTALSERCLPETTTLEEWKSHRDEYRRQLQEMLGLWPMPERTALKPVVTGKLEREDFTVEKIYFQASPGLYCTANLYLPKDTARPAATILYACGHARSMTNGISFGNKAVYQNDGAWFARNGYVCLVLDTLLAGEIQGVHTGTRDRGLWWWNSRGYTPAGVEAWFGMRALDYLSTRPEVDTNRFGITGHSGGGAYSWTITALDERIKVAAPLAGMADAHSHILDGVIDRHCDCNFFVNYYGWDFPQIAALVAPRPLLIGGTDNDRLFNLPNTQRLHEKVRRIYQLYGVTNKLGLAIAPGAHEEVPELQLAVMRWFNQQLKGEANPVETVAQPFFAPSELKVFEALPLDAINTNIAETFVPLPAPVKRSREELRRALRGKVFAGWPAEESPLESKRLFSTERDEVRLTAWDFTSQDNVRLRLYLLENVVGPKAEVVVLTVLDDAGWTNWLRNAGSLFADELNQELGGIRFSSAVKAATEWKGELKQKALAFFAPRGVGLNAWSGGEPAQTKIRRRFMLLGQTVDGMRVWDIRRAVQAIHQVREDDRARVELRARGSMAVNALYAALFEPNVKHLELKQLPESLRLGPDYLGVLKIGDLPQVVEP
ncbi:MAG: dienelactone hydrolase family protein [Akkermansiaceae bacterium]|nr:dienelactone hydrolase family protein [Verrucomicrobiales bacterium]